MGSCFICKGETRSLFSLGLQPLANKYPSSIEEFSSEINLEMTAFYCRECNYIHLPCDVDRSVFFEDYYYLSSVNRELVEHFEELAEQVKSMSSSFVLDVGSNDGIFLRPLKALGIRCLGIDPSENVSAIANRAGLETFVGFFDRFNAERIEAAHGKPDLICASSVFTHLDDPIEFFSTADRLLAQGGAIIVEVEYLGSIMESLAFERFYFDRPHYYSVKSLGRIAERAGFSLTQALFVRAHGGSVRAIFHRKGTAEVSAEVVRLINSEELVLNEERVQDRFKAFQSAAADLKASIEKMHLKGRRIAAYGCPARFSTITNFCGLDSTYIPYVIDDSPLKSGRFSPGQHIPIVSFSSAENIDLFIVFAYEYVDSIKKKVGPSEIDYYRPVPFELI